MSLLDAVLQKIPVSEGLLKVWSLMVSYRCWDQKKVKPPVSGRTKTKVRNLEEQCLQRCNAEAKKARPSSRCSHSAFSDLDVQLGPVELSTLFGMGCYNDVILEFIGKI